ncbi:hypothetical protein UA08_05727 [Talaromyces atroroseus]|uniref:Uncharacterized protein n=1 Tax=Talaromyces atroroseus TaxID=1441469 RepID=A0A225AWA9_TALAT|nr:hypothetical protein UA08_05727 [Talaromyces atroroseus]OKL59246.1 hypothetical protein UA08_05727 [Talaromyces atroroseus]
MARNSCYLEGLRSEEMVMDQLVDAYRLRVEDERLYCGRLRGRYSVNSTRMTAAAPADAERSASSTTSQALQYALQDFQDFLDLAESESRNNNHDNEAHHGYGNAEEEEEDMNGDSSSPSSSTTMNTDTDNSSSSSPSSSLTLTTTMSTMANETSKQGKDTTVLPQWWNAEKRGLCEARAIDGSGDVWSNLGQPAGKDDILDHYQDNLMPMKLRMLAERVYGSDVMGQSRL